MNTDPRYTLISVSFGFGGETVIPAEELCARYDAGDFLKRAHKAMVRDNVTGEASESWAKVWTVWDFTKQAHRLVRVGIGAYGDVTVFENPDVVGRKIAQVYDETHKVWTNGINHPTAEPTRRAVR